MDKMSEKTETTMVMTKDGECPAENAVALNHRRVAALVRLVRQNQLPNFTGDPKVEAEKLGAELAKAKAEMEKAEEESAAADDREKVAAKVRLAEKAELWSKLSDRLRKIRIVKTAETHLAALAEKGPLAFCFAAEDSTAAAPYQQFYGAPDRSNFPTHFGLGETPLIFVPYLTAQSAFLELTAKRERDKREREAEVMKKRASEADQNIASANERASQAETDIALMDALDAESDPGLQTRVDNLREERKAANKAKQDREREERNKRLVSARGDLIALVDGKLRVAAFYSKKRGYWMVADTDKHVLSISRLAGYHDTPKQDIASSLPSSKFSGKGGDTYPNGSDERCAWTIGTFTFILTDKNDRPIMVEIDGKKVPATTMGFAILRSGAEYVDSEVSQLKRLVEERKLDWKAFREQHHMKDLDRAAKWASDTLATSRNRRDDTPQGDTPEGGKPARRDRGNGKRHDAKSNKGEGPKEGKPKAEPPKPQLDSAETENNSNNTASTEEPRPMEARSDLPPNVTRNMPGVANTALADKLKTLLAKQTEAQPAQSADPVPATESAPTETPAPAEQE